MSIYYENALTCFTKSPSISRCACASVVAVTVVSARASVGARVGLAIVLVFIICIVYWVKVKLIILKYRLILSLESECLGRARNRSGFDWPCCVLILSHTDYIKAYDKFEMRLTGESREKLNPYLLYSNIVCDWLKAYYVLVRLKLFLYYDLLFQFI